MELLSCILVSCLPVLAAAAESCNCGFTTTINAQSVLFTEAFETDFRHVTDLKPSEWRPQTYNNTPEASHGQYGRLYSNATTLATTSGSDAGLRLIVSSSIVESLVPSAEVATKRNDFFYGTYRVGMELSSEPGTCAAFYWVRDVLSLSTSHHVLLNANIAFSMTVLQRHAGNRHGVPLQRV